VSDHCSIAHWPCRGIPRRVHKPGLSLCPRNWRAEWRGIKRRRYEAGIEWNGKGRNVFHEPLASNLITKGNRAISGIEKSVKPSQSPPAHRARNPSRGRGHEESKSQSWRKDRKGYSIILGFPFLCKNNSFGRHTRRWDDKWQKVCHFLQLLFQLWAWLPLIYLPFRPLQQTKQKRDLFSPTVLIICNCFGRLLIKMLLQILIRGVWLGLVCRRGAEPGGRRREGTKPGFWNRQYFNFMGDVTVKQSKKYD
jgi:hypothetical protein